MLSPNISTNYIQDSCSSNSTLEILIESATSVAKSVDEALISNDVDRIKLELVKQVNFVELFNVLRNC